MQGSKSKRSVDEGTSLEGRSSVSECQSVRVVHVGQEGRVRESGSQVPTEEGGSLGVASHLFAGANDLGVERIS